jgi:hypothetical protein
MSPAEIALWIAAAAFVAVIVAKIVRDVVRPSDPESPYDV